MLASLIVVLIGYSLIITQIVHAVLNKRWSVGQGRPKNWGGTYFTLSQHGGFWADVFIITPLIAWMVYRYELAYFSERGIEYLFISLLAMYAFLGIFERLSTKYKVSEAYVECGFTTGTGQIHAAYATLVLWSLLLFFCGPVTPISPKYIYQDDMIWVGAALCIFFPIGAVKFSSRWVLDRGFILQVCILWAITIAVVVTRIYVEFAHMMSKVGHGG